MTQLQSYAPAPIYYEQAAPTYTQPQSTYYDPYASAANSNAAPAYVSQPTYAAPQPIYQRPVVVPANNYERRPVAPEIRYGTYGDSGLYVGSTANPTAQSAAPTFERLAPPRGGPNYLADQINQGLNSVYQNPIVRDAAGNLVDTRASAGYLAGIEARRAAGLPISNIPNETYEQASRRASQAQQTFYDAQGRAIQQYHGGEPVPYAGANDEYRYESDRRINPYVNDVERNAYNQGLAGQRYDAQSARSSSVYADSFPDYDANARRVRTGLPPVDLAIGAVAIGGTLTAAGDAWAGNQYGEAGSVVLDNFGAGPVTAGDAARAIYDVQVLGFGADPRGHNPGYIRQGASAARSLQPFAPLPATNYDMMTSQSAEYRNPYVQYPANTDPSTVTYSAPVVQAGELYSQPQNGTTITYAADGSFSGSGAHTYSPSPAPAQLSHCDSSGCYYR